MKKERLVSGKARVQYIACKEEIEKLLESGETLTGAYKILVERGTITMPYKSLHRFVSGITRLRTVIKKKGEKKSNTESVKAKDENVESSEADNAYEVKTIHSEKKAFLRPNDTNGI